MALTLYQKRKAIETLSQAFNDAKKLGININQAVLTAQALHESAWLTSKLALQANNLFGIKASSFWKGETILMQGFEWNPKTRKMENQDILWRKYSSFAPCIKNYSDIINLNPWYQDALPFVNGPSDQFLANIIAEGPSKNWPKGEPGWATDPDYAKKVKTVATEVQYLGGPKWV